MPQENLTQQTADKSLFNNQELEIVSSSAEKKIATSTLVLILLSVFVICIFFAIFIVISIRSNQLTPQTSSNKSNNTNLTKSSESNLSKNSKVSDSISSEAISYTSSSLDSTTSSKATSSSSSFEYTQNNGKFIYFKYPKGWAVDVWPTNGVASYAKETLNNQTNLLENIQCSFSGIRKVIAKSTTTGYEVGSVHPMITSGKSDNNCICDNDCGGIGCAGTGFNYNVSFDVSTKIVTVKSYEYISTGENLKWSKDFQAKDIFMKYIPEMNSMVYLILFNEGGYFLGTNKETGINTENIHEFKDPISKNGAFCSLYDDDQMKDFNKIKNVTIESNALTDSIGGNVTYTPYYNNSYLDSAYLYFYIGKRSLQTVKLTCSTATTQEEFENCIEPLQIYLQSAKRYK